MIFFRKTFHVTFSKLVMILVLLAFMGCKSSKAIIESGEASEKLSAKQVIKQHQKRDVNFKTLQAKVKIELTEKDKQNGFTFNLRMQKDEVIWLSAPLGLARMKITPQNVQFYNKTDNTYFDDDYKLLSDVVGVDLDFLKVQNILLGQAIYSLKDESFTVSINENSYTISPKTQNVLLELFYLVNPSHFKMDSMQLYQKLEKRFLQIDYKAYQDVGNQVIPKTINVIAVEDMEEIAIDLEIKSVSLNGELRFPFKIPSGYDEIEIK